MIRVAKGEIHLIREEGVITFRRSFRRVEHSMRRARG